MIGFVLRLVLTERQEASRKWPVTKLGSSPVRFYIRVQANCSSLVGFHAVSVSILSVESEVDVSVLENLYILLGFVY